MTRTLCIKGPGFAAALLCCTGSALGNTPTTLMPDWQASMDFDLSRDCPRLIGRAILLEPGGDPGAIMIEKRAIDPASMSSKEELGPRWTFQPSRAGPLFEFAALGAGKKERPGLVHVAMGWNF